MGFFFRHLGRGRVCAVYETGVERPSDIDGILYIRYDAAGKWRHDLATEIKEAGFDVDVSRVR
jgi:predicted nucleotide-binding protein